MVGGGEEVRKLNAYELIATSILWCLDIQSLTTTYYKAFLEHLCLIAIRAKDSYYRDSAHVAYVLAIRRMAEKQGFAAQRRAQGKVLSTTHPRTC